MALDINGLSHLRILKFLSCEIFPIDPIDQQEVLTEAGTHTSRC